MAKKKLTDLTGDGKITQADVLKGRGVFAEGGDVNKQMEMMLGGEEETSMEEPMVPDETMEKDYLDFILDEALDEEEEDLGEGGAGPEDDRGLRGGVQGARDGHVRGARQVQVARKRAHRLRHDS